MEKAKIKEPNDQHLMLIDTVRSLCEKYGETYWKRLEAEHSYPEEFVSEMESLGITSIPIPQEYGGPSLGLREACLVLEEINSSGGNSQPFHGQYYLLFIISKFASERIKREYLLLIAEGKRRIQTLALAEPEAGSDSTKIKTHAEKKEIIS